MTDWIVSLMELLGAPGVGLGVFLENIFPPIPSEVILPLAGFTASQGGMSVTAAIIWSVVGSVVGAFLLYGLGAAVGAERLRRIADRMWLVEGKDVDKALEWFDRFGTWSVFFGRLVPGVRSLISIPAGLHRMNLWVFGLLTFTGSTIWNTALILAGLWLGERWETVSHLADQYSLVVYGLLALAVIVVIVYLVRRKAGTPDTTK